MKLWIDDVRPAPNGWKWAKSVHEAIIHICQMTRSDGSHNIEIMSIDHDAGDWVWNGGDYIKILDWMEDHGVNDIPIHIHSMNSVGRENMRRIITHNGWREVYKI